MNKKCSNLLTKGTIYGYTVIMGAIKLNDELIKEIAEHISNGLMFKDACLIVGISTRSFEKWRQHAKEELENDVSDSLYIRLLRAVKEAEAAFKEFHLSNIKKHANKQWQASAWLLERKYKDEFGRIPMDVNLSSSNTLVDEIKKLREGYQESDSQKSK